MHVGGSGTSFSLMLPNEPDPSAKAQRQAGANRTGRLRPQLTPRAK